MPDYGLLIFTSTPEYSEVWSENGGYVLYHASLSPEEYKKILNKNNLKILMHKVKDPGSGKATVWVLQMLIHLSMPATLRSGCVGIEQA